MEKANGHAVETPLTLVEKLAAACDEVGGVEKKGKNLQQNYAYVKAADVAKAIRHELFSRGVVIIPNEESVEWVEFETKSGGVMNECRLKVAYHIRDSKDEIVMHAFGVARDSGDKAIYKAKTGAQKYFLRALGLIPDEKDDVEADETVDKAEFVRRQPRADAPESGRSQPINQNQKNAFWSACKKSGKTNDQVMEYFGQLGIEHTEEMLNKDFGPALKWAMEAA